MLTIRKDINQVRQGDRFQWFGRMREVVRVRCIEIPVILHTGARTGNTVPGVEILHKCPHRAGVDYIQIPQGSQLAVLIP